MKSNVENSLKRFLKRKVKVTLGFMVAFMISGSIGYAESIIPKSEDTEILLFMTGNFKSFENEKIDNIGEFKLGENTIKPPVTPERPSVPWEDLTPTQPIERPSVPWEDLTPAQPIERPSVPWEDLTPAQPIEKLTINNENRVLENTTIFTIKDGETFINKGNLSLKSDIEMLDTDNDHVYDTPSADYSVIKNNGGKVINEGTLAIEGLKDVNIAGTGTIIKTGEGIGVHQTAGTFENKGTINIAGNGFDGDKDGYTDTNGGIGVLVEGGTAINNGTITSPDSYTLPKPNGGLMLGRGIGMKALNGTIENGGLIKNQAISMIAENKGTAINNGTIETEQIGLMALNGGTATNNGTIKAWKNEKEGHKGEATTGLYSSSFNGAETIVKNSSTGIVYGSVKAEGTGATVINDGTIYGKKIEANRGTIVNNGTITGEATKPVINIEGGKFVQGNQGKLEANKVNGDIYLSGNYAENNFNDKISINDNISIKEHNGDIKSDSVMYKYNSEDKTLERKEFSEILSNQNFANYLENNYLDGDIIRQELYNNLKLIDNAKEFNRATNNLFGNDIYPALNKQTFDMIRFNKNTLVENVFNIPTEKEWRVIGGGNYTNIEADSSNLSGYETDIKAVFVGADKQINPNHRLGGIINVGTLVSDFDDNARREDTFVQGNLYSIYNYKDIQFINNFFIGLSDGELERDLKFGDVKGRQKGDIDTNYIGLNNIISKTLNVTDSFYVKPQIELNLTQLQVGDIKESGNYGLEIEKQDVTSVEAGFGLEAGKYFDITDNVKGAIKVSGTYLAELSNPYDEMSVKLRQIKYSDSVKISEYDDEDYKDLGIKLELSNESFTTYVEYKHTFGDGFYTAGINYRF